MTTQPHTKVGTVPEATLVEKFRQLDAALSVELIERSDVALTMQLALVARVHHFQIGPPGIAKSHAIRTLRSHIGGLLTEEYFAQLLTKFSHLDDVFGPTDLMALKEGRHSRLAKGYLPLARLAMLDEIFKCNAALLNAMLLILNEREYKNDGLVLASPLWTCFAGSNEMPEGEELDALYDRLQLRVEVRDISEPGNFIRMLMLDQIGPPKVILDWDDIEKAHAEATSIEIDPEVPEALSDIRSKLKDDGIEPSSRRFRECMRIMQAHAWLDGREKVVVDDTRVLAHVLWTEKAHFARVQRLLIEFASPFELEVAQVREVTEQQSNELDELLKGPDDGQFRVKKAVEIQQKMGEIRADIERLGDIMRASGRSSRAYDELSTRSRQVLQRLLVDVFAIPVEVAEQHVNAMGSPAI